MTSEVIAKELAEIEAEYGKLMSELDTLMVQALAPIAKSAAEWIRGEVARTVAEKPAEIQALGVERLRQLKVQVEELVASVPHFVEQRTGEKLRWPHYTLPRDEGVYGALEREYFLVAYRDTLGTLGAVLADFDLVRAPKGLNNKWERVGQGKWRYAIGMLFEPKNVPEILQYGQHLAALETVYKRRAAKQAALEAAKARELWESA